MFVYPLALALRTAKLRQSFKKVNATCFYALSFPPLSSLVFLCRQRQRLVATQGRDMKIGNPSWRPKPAPRVWAKQVSRR